MTTDRQLLQLQARTIKHMRDTMVQCVSRCEDHVKFCRDNNYKPSKVAEDVHHRLKAELEYLDVQGMKADLARRKELPEEQGQL
jgi:hypothetical protein